MVTQNFISYDQQSLQNRLSTYFAEEKKINFIMEYGSGKFSNFPLSYNSEWDNIKSELINEYDDLWRELAQS